MGWRRERWLFRAFATAYLVLPVPAVTPWLDVAHVSVPVRWRRLGTALLWLGIGLFSWAHQALGRNWTAVLALSTDHELVTTGPYRHVRHPMYTGFFTVGVGFALLSANWLVAALCLGTLAPTYVLSVSAEEQMMARRFGDRYRRYVEVTGRLLPRGAGLVTVVVFLALGALVLIRLGTGQQALRCWVSWSRCATPGWSASG